MPWATPTSPRQEAPQAATHRLALGTAPTRSRPSDAWITAAASSPCGLLQLSIEQLALVPASDPRTVVVSCAFHSRALAGLSDRSGPAFVLCCRMSVCLHKFVELPEQDSHMRHDAASRCDYSVHVSFPGCLQAPYQTTLCPQHPCYTCTQAHSPHSHVQGSSSCEGAPKRLASAAQLSCTP